jgi:replication-associated recombination protein RarA
MKPILNPASEKLILATINSMPQSLLVTGPKGVGLLTSAKYISQLLKVKPTIILPEKDEKINLEAGIITVDIMRKIADSVRTKSVNKNIIIIDYAERMNTQAQNSFLKLLEEPNENIYFILVSNSVSKLLPTTLSRVKKIDIKPITNDQSKQLLDTLKVNDETKRSQLLFMASGLPAELTRLVENDDYFNKSSEVMKDARELLQGKVYQKLLIAQKYKDDRGLTLDLLLAVTKILKHSIDNKPQIDTIKRIDIVLKTYQRIEANGNIRLCLANMVL